ncbi:MAG: hypothetical protein ABIQ09_00875 [Jatrophihabitantaceae bacterium]
MPRSHRTRALLVTGLTVLGLGITPLSAQATTLIITSLSCEPTVSAIHCEATVSGGTPAYTYSWNPSGSLSNGGAMNTLYCAPGYTFIVTVRVTDRLGASASKTISAYCAGGTP